jgi:hypothetical protein
MYRTIDTQIWKDPWVADLCAPDKLLFLYCFTNDRSTPCGAYEIRKKDIAYETGLTEEQVEAGLERLHPKVMWWPSARVILVTNFYKHQRANSSEKFAVAAAKSLLNFPPEISDTLCSLYPELQTAVDTLSGTEGYPPPSHPIPTPIPYHGDGGKETATATGSESEDSFVVVEDAREAKTEKASLAIVPADTPPQYQQEMALRARLFAAAESLMTKGVLTKAHKGKLDGWLAQHKKRLTVEVIEYAVEETAGHTGGDALDYLLKVIVNRIENPNGRPTGGTRNGTHKPAGPGKGNTAADAAFRNFEAIAGRARALAGDDDQRRLSGPGKDTA